MLVNGGNTCVDCHWQYRLQGGMYPERCGPKPIDIVVCTPNSHSNRAVLTTSVASKTMPTYSMPSTLSYA